MGKRLMQIFIGLIGLILLLAAAGFIYQRMATARGATAYPPPGQLIDVGGHQLHIHCLGEGEPTLIVDTGAADWSLSWLTLHPKLAKQTRTCLYDRAGLGWSEPGPMPRASKQLVTELHTLLNNANIEPPYILLGHSLGGYNARIFHEQFPDEVRGIILLDSAHEKQWEQFPTAVSDLVTQQVGLLQSMTTLSQLGIALSAAGTSSFNGRFAAGLCSTCSTRPAICGVGQ
ncbi:MAG: alpha/beta hydrolase [Chloroflexota bacterium]